MGRKQRRTETETWRHRPRDRTLVLSRESPEMHRTGGRSKQQATMFNSYPVAHLSYTVIHKNIPLKCKLPDFKNRALSSSIYQNNFELLIVK